MRRLFGMKKVIMVALALVLVVPLFVAAAVPASACTPGFTPGYWKNHTEAWKIYTTGQLYRDVFGLNGKPAALAALDTLKWKGKGTTAGRDMTLLNALSIEGGGNQGAFVRYTVASLLNDTRVGANTSYIRTLVPDVFPNGGISKGEPFHSLEWWNIYLESFMD